MSQAINVRQVERRAQQYWNVDGLPEVVMGLLWIVWGVSWLVGEMLPRGPVWDIYRMFTPLLLVCSSVAAVWATKALKARITFPRAGYVDWKPPTRRHRLTAAAIAAIISVGVLAMVVSSRTGGVEQIAAPLIGIVMCVAFAIASVIQRAPYLLVLAAASLVLGLVLGTVIRGWDGLNWMLVALGATSFVLGAVRLWWFVRTHPRDNPA
jgi:hypothetical protein